MKFEEYVSKFLKKKGYHWFGYSFNEYYGEFAEGLNYDDENKPKVFDQVLLKHDGENKEYMLKASLTCFQLYPIYGDMFLRSAEKNYSIDWVKYIYENNKKYRHEIRKLVYKAKKLPKKLAWLADDDNAKAVFKKLEKFIDEKYKKHSEKEDTKSNINGKGL